MAAAKPREPNLPWADYGEDRGFRWLAGIMLLLFLVGGLVLNRIVLPEIEQKRLSDVSPRLAKLILEKQKVKPPPPKPEAKKEEPKKKEEVKKKEEPKKEQSAREVAKSSGLIALADELDDLRESFALDDVLELPQQTSGAEEIKVAAASDLLSSAVGQSSGGIRTDTLNRKLTTSELAQRKTTSVESKIDSGQQVASLDSGQQQQGGASGSGSRRSDVEIERVFQKNKGAIFNLYNRALRQNPSLAGKVVVELTIAPNGEVTSVNILSSELGDEALERKLALRIKKFKFAARAGAAETVVKYPIDFLPS